MSYQTKNGAHPSIKINVLRELPPDRYLAVLTRLRDAILAGRPLDSDDDTTPGNKSTSCSWGLCHESAETWPDAQDHTFPVDFEQRGRISHLHAPGPCPMDARTVADGNGCFWTCRVFKARKYGKLTRAEALGLYEEAIARCTPQPADAVGNQP